MRIARRLLVAAACAQIGFSLATPAQAQIPRGLGDLIGNRAGQGELALRQRGYTVDHTDTGRNASFTYWRRGNDCVQVTTRDGRFLTMTEARNMCSSHGSGSDGDKAAAVVAGVAIIGLAAALAAHNKDHKDADRDHDADYSRGYQAGLDGSNYDERRDTEGYHDGFVAGESERANRRYSGTSWVRSAPQAARDACAQQADDFQNRPRGSSVTIGTRDLGRGDYELTMGTGSYRSRCVVSSSGAVRSINPY